MSAAEALQTARAASVNVVVDGDHLMLGAEKAPPNEVIAKLSRHKAEIIELLRLTCNSHPACAAQRVGFPESWARELARLDPGCPPADVPPARWEQLINDARRFLEDGWAAQATDQGWGPYDLLGCDAAKPYARVDRLGLLWLLDGRPIAALTAETATISTAGGGHLTFRRRPIEPDLALAWTLQGVAREVGA